MKEYEIQPEALLNRYLELSAWDVECCFGNLPRMGVVCVARGSAEATHLLADDLNAVAFQRFLAYHGSPPALPGRQ